MSTQAARSIRFTHTLPQQGFKLLELPPDLLELLSSKDAPTLELKSPSTTLAQTTAEPGAREYVNLCTPTKTYRVRQVQSSNSIHIVRPSQGDTQGDENNKMIDVDDMDLVETVTAIAKCGSTLELHTPPGGFSAVPFLEKRLKMYSRLSSDGDVEMREAWVDLEPSEQRRLTEEVFADVPVSRAECERGWIELCGFVHGDAGSDRATCWRPSAMVKLDAWKRILEGAVLQGIDLEKQFLVRDIWKSMFDHGDEEPFPRTLIEAVVRRVCDLEAVQGQQSLSSEFKWASIDKVRCVQWVGETYLEAMAPETTSAIGRSEFLNAWKDLLLEPWRSEVAFSKLGDGTYNHPDATTVCFVNDAERQKVKKGLPVGTSAATAAKSSRNWHELLKNQKRR